MIDAVQIRPSRILSWKYEEIERKVVDLYIEQNIHSLPIDPFEIIKKRKYEFVPFSKLKLDFLEETFDKQNDAFSFYSTVDKTYIIAFDDKTSHFDIDYHKEPKITGNKTEKIFHIHFYDKNGVRDVVGRRLTKEEFDLYKKFFRGRRL